MQNNTIVPIDSNYKDYQTIRANLALPQTSLLSLQIGGQSNFGLHPNLPDLQGLFQQSKVSGETSQRLKISDNLFERKQYCRQRGVEGRRYRCRCANRQQRFYFFWTQPQETSKHRGNARAHLNRRPFAPQRYSARQRSRCTKEFS